MTTATAQTELEILDDLSLKIQAELPTATGDRLAALIVAGDNVISGINSITEFPWRRHDARIYRERAQVALQAAAHLIEA
jgi:hypothetical protein